MVAVANTPVLRLTSEGGGVPVTVTTTVVLVAGAVTVTITGGGVKTVTDVLNTVETTVAVTTA